MSKWVSDLSNKQAALYKCISKGNTHSHMYSFATVSARQGSRSVSPVGLGDCMPPTGPRPNLHSITIGPGHKGRGEGVEERTRPRCKPGSSFDRT